MSILGTVGILVSIYRPSRMVKGSICWAAMMKFNSKSPQIPKNHPFTLQMFQELFFCACFGNFTLDMSVLGTVGSCTDLAEC